MGYEVSIISFISKPIGIRFYGVWYNGRLSVLCFVQTFPIIGQFLGDKEQDKKENKKKKGCPEKKKPSPPYILWCKDNWNEVKTEKLVLWIEQDAWIDVHIGDFFVGFFIRLRKKIQRLNSKKFQTFWERNGRMSLQKRRSLTRRSIRLKRKSICRWLRRRSVRVKLWSSWRMSTNRRLQWNCLNSISISNKKQKKKPRRSKSHYLFLQVVSILSSRRY